VFLYFSASFNSLTSYTIDYNCFQTLQFENKVSVDFSVRVLPAEKNNQLTNCCIAYCQKVATAFWLNSEEVPAAPEVQQLYHL